MLSLLTGPVVGVDLSTNIVLRITGAVATPVSLSLADLNDYKRHDHVGRDHDGTEAEYEGVELYELLRRVDVPFRENLRGAALRMGVLVKAADGYAALFSLAELDPDMNGKKIFLADRSNGAQLGTGQGPLRLIVAEEKRPARWVREVVELEVVRVGEAVKPSPPSVSHPQDAEPKGVSK